MQEGEANQLVGIETLSQLEPPVLRMIMQARDVRLPNVLLGEPASVVITDHELRIVHVGGPSFETPGFRAEELVGRLVSEVLMPPDDRSWITDRYQAALEGEPQRFEYLGPGGRHAFRVQLLPLAQGPRGLPGVISISEDITQQIHMTMELSRAQARLSDAERMVGLGSWELALEDRSITFSEGYARALGLNLDEPFDFDRLLERILPEDRPSMGSFIEECLRGGSTRSELRITRGDGVVRLFEVAGERVAGADGQPRFVRGMVLDVTDEHEADRERIEALSLFQQGFDAAPIGMALVDSDTGAWLRVNDALCRLLGRTRAELMAMTVHDVVHADELDDSIRSREALRDGLPEFNGERRYVRPDGSTVWGAVHLASVATIEGPTTVIFVQVVDITHRKQREAAMERELDIVQWLARIRDALDHDRLRLYAQPIVDLRTGETVQQELLLRMLGEDGEVIGSHEFLPAAERYGLITEIDRWVIAQAVRSAGLGVPCEFNLSAASLDNPAVLDAVQTALEQTGVDPSLLVIEVTETAMMKRIEAGKAFARRVRELGCGLALDDFGTGFASLAYLKHLPASHLKIDIEFIRDLTRSADDERVVRGIVALAREFGQTCVAEGVENEETLFALREIGVEYGQGYLFGHPAPLGDSLVSPGVTEGGGRLPTDPVATAEAMFEVFVTDDVERALRFMHPEIVLRPFRTMELAGRLDPYRGHDGVRRFLGDVAEVWDDLQLRPSMFREIQEGVIVFGQLEGHRDGNTETSDVVWVLRFRGGLLISLDVAQSTVET